MTQKRNYKKYDSEMNQVICLPYVKGVSDALRRALSPSKYVSLSSHYEQSAVFFTRLRGRRSENSKEECCIRFNVKVATSRTLGRR